MAIQQREDDDGAVQCRHHARTVAHTARHQALSKQILLTLEYADDAPWYVISDPTRLHQIMLNLISNSIKFTPPQGTITLSVRAYTTNPYERPAQCSAATLSAGTTSAS